MDEFFAVLREGLAAVRLPSSAPTSRIVFHVTGLATQIWTVSLSPMGCHVVLGDHPFPELTLYCDTAQLEDMLKTGFSGRPLRYVGDRQLLDELARLLPTPLNPVSIRSKRNPNKR